jgi:hypothetical protein
MPDETPKDPTDLAWVTTADLAREIGTRFDHIAIVGSHEMVNNEESFEEGFFTYYSPDLITTLGLLVIAQQDILKDFNAGLRDEPDDDPDEYEDE